MQLLNQNEIYETWSPIIESKTGMTDRSKVEWLSKYCHFHSLNESAGAYNSLSVLNGMGAIQPPTNYATSAGGIGAGPAGFYYNNTYDAGRPYVGSGDKFPSLLPLAIQVAAKTVGFDIVPVIPMAGPTGVLSYLDYVYAGGTLAGTSTDSTTNYTANTPDMIKIPTAVASPATGLTVGNYYVIGVGLSSSVNLATGGDALVGQFVGNSRIDGFPIFRISAIGNGDSVATVIPAAGTADIYASSWTPGTALTSVNVGSLAASTAGSAVLVKTLEDHIQGFTGAGTNNTNNWQGPYVDGTQNYDPMSRGVAESTYYKSLGLSTFTKFVEAGTFQVAASVTTEQIQDLNKQFGIDVVSMIENALVNEVSQAINKHILSRGFALGWSNHCQFYITESTNLNLNLVIGGAATYTIPSYINKMGSQTTPGTTGVPGPVAGPASGTFENLSTVQRRLYSRILAAANVVANRGRRGPANFIVTNSQIASALQDISQFTFAPFTNTLTQNNGTLYPVGSLAGMTVYVDQNMAFGDTRVLIGRKGADDEPGMKFMPYMMAESIQTISEGTMSPKIAVKSRYSLVEAGHLPETMYFTFHVNTGTATAII